MKIRRNLFCCLLSLLVFGLIGGTPGCSQTTNSIPAELRQGNFSCDKATIQSALELTRAGWTYIMPGPKSPQAAWGNTDGRTTWWIGYWINGKDNSTSLTRPKKDADGKIGLVTEMAVISGDVGAVHRRPQRSNGFALNLAAFRRTDFFSMTETMLYILNQIIALVWSRGIVAPVHTRCLSK